MNFTGSGGFDMLEMWKGLWREGGLGARSWIGARSGYEESGRLRRCLENEGTRRVGKDSVWNLDQRSIEGWLRMGSQSSCV